MSAFPDWDVRHHEYLVCADTHVLVSKIFSSTVGLAPEAGEPAVFIRLAGCNRGSKKKPGCELCPSDFRFGLAQRLTFAEVVTEVAKITGGEGKPPVYITGGEPMMQSNLVKLVERLAHAGFPIRIESNGDTLVHGFLENEACRSAQLFISPKFGPRPEDRVLDRADRIRLLVSSTPPGSQFYSVPESYLCADWRHKLQLIPLCPDGKMIPFIENVQHARKLGTALDIPIAVPVHHVLGWEQ